LVLVLLALSVFFQMIRPWGFFFIPLKYPLGRNKPNFVVFMTVKLIMRFPNKFCLFNNLKLFICLSD
jgi:hypothetical protein